MRHFIRTFGRWVTGTASTAGAVAGAAMLATLLAAVLAATLGSCRHREPLPTANLEDGYLTVALEADATDYFLYKGHPMGYHLELLQQLARYLDKRLVVINGKSMEEQHDLLHNGEVDLIAANWSVTPKREEHFLFTHALYATPQVLVQLKKEYLSDSALYMDSLPQLFGQHIDVRKHSVFADRLHEINDEQAKKAKAEGRQRPHKIHASNSDLSEEDLLQAVATGNLPYTVASQNKAAHYAITHPQLDVHLILSEPQDVAWVLRQTDTLLQQKINHWIDSVRKTRDFKYLFHKYYEISFRHTVKSTESGFRKMDSVNHRRKQRQAELLVEEGVLEADDTVFLYRLHRPRKKAEKPVKSQISPFDTLLKQYAPEIPWDWRLLASLIYQESQFETHLISKKGAIGLMQFMPATAHRYKITIRSGEEAQIKAGVKYIKSIYSYFPDTIDEVERARFVLASYNIGPAHVLDARRLAAKYGADADVWYDNVERYLLLMSKPEYYRDSVCRNGRAFGRQTADFVRKIEERYLHYRNFINE